MAADEFKVRFSTLLRAMGKTLSSVSLYTLKHPAVQNSIAENHAALELLLRETGEISLSLDKDTMLANGLVVAASGQVPPALLNFFKRYELHGLGFLPGVTIAELSTFFETLILKPEALQGKKLGEFLQERGVNQIRPNSAVYVKMEKGAAGGDAAVVVSGAPAAAGAGAGAGGAGGDGGAGAGAGPGGGVDWTKMPLDDAITVLVEQAVADPWERTQIIKALKDRLKNEIEERIQKATVQLRQDKTKLTNEKQRTDSVLNNMSEAVVMVDDNGNVMMMNQAAEALYGRKLSELAGKPLLSAVKGDEQVVSLAEQISTPVEGDVSQGLVAVGEQNAARALKQSSAVVRNESGAVVGMVSSLPDAAKFREYQRMQDEFIANVTHELRSPLTSITAALSLLDDQFAGRLSSDQDRIMRLATRNADRLAQLINEILDFSKLESGQMTVHPAPLEVKKALKDAADSLEPWARTKGVSLKIQPKEDVPKVFADPKRVTQILVNLTSNAIKFSPKGSTVDFTAAVDPQDASFVRFTVTDHGPGMTKADTERLFQKFVQLMAGETQAVGTGLGLSIAKALVSLQKGRIWVESAPGRGSSFFFTLQVFRPEMIGDVPKLVVAPVAEAPKTWWQRLFGG